MMIIIKALDRDSLVESFKPPHRVRLYWSSRVPVLHYLRFQAKVMKSQHDLINEIEAKWKNVIVITLGLPAVIVALSLGIAAGKDGIQSFVNDK